MRVAFQGELGAFSQQAIRQLLGPRAEPAPYQRFDEVFAALRAEKVDAAVLPIENTLHGSVHENYDLLLRYDFEITAETSVRIVHNLIAPPGVTFERIRKVYSHPVALNQCLDFFRRYKKVERVTFYDTAGSVKMIMKDRPTDAAAIASTAAESCAGRSKTTVRTLRDFFCSNPPDRNHRRFGERRRIRGRRPWYSRPRIFLGHYSGLSVRWHCAI
jgi:prephenate dehydratase